MVYILLGDGFEEIEALAPGDLLRRAGIEVRFVGVGDKTVVGGQGIAVQADITLDEVDVANMQMLVLPGGTGGVATIANSEQATALIHTAVERNCWLAAICAAPTLLDKLGALNGRNAVCYPTLQSKMTSATVCAEQQVVVDGHIITGEAAGSAVDFGLKLIEVLEGAEKAEEIRNGIYYRTTKNTAEG